MFYTCFSNSNIILFSANYNLARQKLKEAENISDLNSGTELDEHMKKSRKIRAAKIFDDFTSSDEALSDDDTFISELPQIQHVTTATKVTKVKTQKGTKILIILCIPRIIIIKTVIMFNLDDTNMHRPRFEGKKYTKKMKVDKMSEKHVGK